MSRNVEEVASLIAQASQRAAALSDKSLSRLSFVDSLRKFSVPELVEFLAWEDVRFKSPRPRRAEVVALIAEIHN